MKKRSIVNTTNLCDVTGRLYYAGQVVCTNWYIYGKGNIPAFAVVVAFTEKSVEVTMKEDTVKNALAEGGHVFQFTPHGYGYEGKLMAPGSMIIFPT
jgi:hypothetical protein